MKPSKTKGKPTNEDLLIGKNLKLIRLYRDFSQDQLAVKIGITFQQVQKYENGINRISGSRFIDLSKALDVPILAFFDGIVSSSDHQLLLDVTKYQRDILIALLHINDPKIEKSILNLCENIKIDIKG